MNLSSWMGHTFAVALPLTSFPILREVMLEAGQPTDSTYVWGIVATLGATVTSMAAFAWRQRELRAKSERKLAERDTELAVCRTQLSAYGKSAPELAEEVRWFGEQLARLIEEESDQRSSSRHRERRERLPWPMDRPRPTAPRRRG